MPQVDLFAGWRFTYPDDIKAIEGIVAMLTQRAAKTALADAAYVAAGLTGAPRTDPLWGTAAAIERDASAITKQQALRTILDAREAWAVETGIDRYWFWTTATPLITSHTTITVAALDGSIEYQQGEETPDPAADNAVIMTGDFALRLNAETAWPNQHLLIAGPGLPAVVRVYA